MIVGIFERIERKFKTRILSACLQQKDGVKKVLEPFELQPIRLEYDVEGNESCVLCGEVEYAIRFTPESAGELALSVLLENGETVIEDFKACEPCNNGYVEISREDRRYFSYSDGTPFYPDQYVLSNRKHRFKRERIWYNRRE